MIPETCLCALIFLSLSDFHFLFFLAARKKENAVDDRLGKNFLFIIHLTDTAAILNLLDLRSIMGYPGGMSTIRYTGLSINARFSGRFFFKFS